MTTARIKLVSGLLSKELIQEALRALPGIFKELLGNCIVHSMYGVGTRLHVDLQWKNMDVGTAWLDRFIAESLEYIVEVGESDFYFTVPEDRLEIVFCHESDIHLEANDEGLLQALLSHSPFRDVSFE